MGMNIIQIHSYTGHSLLIDVMRRRLGVSCRRFGTTYRPIFEGGTNRCPRNVVKQQPSQKIRLPPSSEIEA